ncbi:Hypothetical predicted protein [Drosophila guanche]|uniref:Uncharacterized protein n=1 Tax=Drosophila guanche TaxID=7266 RepID=A0A3B0JG27_DROGU|nr:Hypothetical predicted protein [Drosophila guanche]
MRGLIVLSFLAAAAAVRADVGGYNYGSGESGTSGGSLSGGSFSGGSGSSLSGGSLSAGSLGSSGGYSNDVSNIGAELEAPSASYIPPAAAAPQATYLPVNKVK